MIWAPSGHEVSLFPEPDQHSMIAGTANSKKAKHHSKLAVTAKIAVTARIREMIYTYMTRAEAITAHLLGDLGAFGARDVPPLRA